MKSIFLATPLLAPSLFPLRADARHAGNGMSGVLRLHNPHNDETLHIRYVDDQGMLHAESCAKLDHFFRCSKTGKVMEIDRDLYVLLDRIATRLGAAERPYVLQSGYRSPRYNSMLRRRQRGVARDSFHVHGMAADVRISGVSLRDLSYTARELNAGGVGRYSRFIHLDVGPARSW